MCGKLPHMETLSNPDNYSYLTCVILLPLHLPKHYYDLWEPKKSVNYLLIYGQCLNGHVKNVFFKEELAEMVDCNCSRQCLGVCFDYSAQEGRIHGSFEHPVKKLMSSVNSTFILVKM